MDEMDSDPLDAEPLHKQLRIPWAAEMQVRGLSKETAQELADAFLGSALGLVTQQIILWAPRDAHVEVLAVQLVRHIWPELVADYEFGEELNGWVAERQRRDGGPTPG